MPSQLQPSLSATVRANRRQYWRRGNVTCTTYFTDREINKKLWKIGRNRKNRMRWALSTPLDQHVGMKKKLLEVLIVLSNFYHNFVMCYFINTDH